jgi:hypothetical protein
MSDLKIASGVLGGSMERRSITQFEAAISPTSHFPVFNKYPSLLAILTLDTSRIY